MEEASEMDRFLGEILEVADHVRLLPAELRQNASHKSGRRSGQTLCMPWTCPMADKRSCLAGGTVSSSPRIVCIHREVCSPEVGVLS